MDYCTCGDRAEFRCQCGRHLCRWHILNSPIYAGGRRHAGGPVSVISDRWAQFPNRMCLSCYLSTRELIADLLLGPLTDDDVLHMIAAEIWCSSTDVHLPAAAQTFGQVLAQRGLVRGEVFAEPLAMAASILARKGLGSERILLVFRRTRQSRWSNTTKETIVEYPPEIYGWSFDGGGYDSYEGILIGPGGGYLLTSGSGGIRAYYRTSKAKSPTLYEVKGGSWSDPESQIMHDARQTLMSAPSHVRKQAYWLDMAAKVAEKALA